MIPHSHAADGSDRRLAGRPEEPPVRCVFLQVIAGFGRRPAPRAAAVLAALASLTAGIPQSFGGAARSPLNQVFQFAHTAARSPEGGGAMLRSTAYLWIPERCERVRGLVIMGNNVPEHMLAGHAAIRDACRASDLALVWAVPTFWQFGKRQEELQSESVGLLQDLLDGLAAESGYAEISSAPWLPIGESGHLLMVCGLIDQKPHRVIAGICVKNPRQPANLGVPLLWTLGTAQEWGQKARDVRKEWNSHRSALAAWEKTRAEAGWPLSIVIEPGTGHFACTDEMAGFFGQYITAAVRARLNADGTLRPVNLDDGYLASLPLPGCTDLDVIPFSEAGPGQRERAWFFTRELALAAQKFAATNWDAETQMVGFLAGNGCEVRPFHFNSVTEIIVRTDAEFSVRGELLETIPDGFVAAGARLSRTPGKTKVEWICGPFAPVADGRFRIALDRTWKTGAASYLIASREGDGRVRRSVQPAMVKIQENTEGKKQTITFRPIPDVSAGSGPIKLSASSDAGLPVEFTVLSGPAVIEDGTLVLTPVPPRTKGPVEVTVGAWQWGRASEPKVQTASMARQTFRVQTP